MSDILIYLSLYMYTYIYIHTSLQARAGLSAALLEQTVTLFRRLQMIFKCSIIWVPRDENQMADYLVGCILAEVAGLAPGWHCRGSGRV